MPYDDELEAMPELVFERPALLPPKEKGGLWELEHDWTLFYKEEVYHIPAGFKTDGASIPRFLWRLCGTPLDVPRIYAAIVHDWLYSGGKPGVTRAEADAIYRDILIALGVSRTRAYVEWIALRLCGGSHWHGDNHEKNERKKPKMKKLTMIAVLAAVAAVAGCKSIEVRRHAQKTPTYTDTNGVVRAVCDTAGKPVLLDGGWEVDYFQHWMWTKLDSLNATAGKDVVLQLNGYESGADSNLVALVDVSFAGGAKLATAIGDAWVKIAGGGAQADAALSSVKKIYSYFTGKGGDASKATVTTEGDKIKVSDGSVCISCDKDGNCTSCTDCTDGGCELK